MKEKDSRKLFERIVMFNDAVYAIALTLLVLELKFPEDASLNSYEDFIRFLHEISPRLFAFLFSVVLVSGNWIAGLGLHKMIARAHGRTVIHTAIYLPVISLMPFCSNVLGNYPDSPYSFVIFGIVQGFTTINNFFFLKHCRQHKLYYDDVDWDEIKNLERIIIPIFFIIIVMTLIAFISTKLSFVLYLALNSIPFFMSSRLSRKYKDDVKENHPI